MNFLWKSKIKKKQKVLILGTLGGGDVYLSASFKSKKLPQMLWTSIKGGKKVLCVLATPKAEDLNFIVQLSEKGKIKPIIDKVFLLAQAADAHAYVESGKNRGTVVLQNA